MKLKDMRPGIRYLVTSDGRVLSKGDSVIVPMSGCLVCWRGGQFPEKCLLEKEWKHLRNTVEIDVDYYRREIAQLVAGIEDCQKIIDKHKSILEGVEP